MGAPGATSTIFLIFLLVFTLAALNFTHFQGRRSVGVLMVAIYLIFLLYVCLSENEVIHDFGADHQEGEKI